MSTAMRDREREKKSVLKFFSFYDEEIAFHRSTWPFMCDQMLGVMRGILDKYGKDENFFPSFELSIITNERVCLK